MTALQSRGGEGLGGLGGVLVGYSVMGWEGIRQYGVGSDTAPWGWKE